MDASALDAHLRVRRRLAFGVTVLVHVALVAGFMLHLQPKVAPGARAGALLVPVTVISMAPPKQASETPRSEPSRVPSEARPLPKPSAAQAMERASPLQPEQAPLESPKGSSNMPSSEQTTPVVQSAPATPEAAAPAEPVVPVGATAQTSARADPLSGARPAGIVTWESQVLAHLERYKRYPAAARLRRQEDVVYVRFVIDRQGHVSNARIVKSQGFVLLDEEVMNLLARAVPMPPLPAEAPGDRVELQVPVEFFMRGG